MEELINNKYLYVPFLLWLGIQVFKVIYDYTKTKKFNLKRMMDSGGIPSSHSAIVACLATLVGKYEGVGTATFAIAVIVALIVMYDACGIRRAAGNQATLLNTIVESKEIKQLNGTGKLKEALGHSPEEVLVGAIVGIIVGLIV